jgi:general secretion pathway protein I
VKQRGFTLLEVLVASAIMGIAVVGVLAALSGTMRNAARLTDYDRAVMIGRAKLDELLLDPRVPRGSPVEGRFDPSLMGGLEGGWTALRTQFDALQAPAPGDQTLDRIELQIWWISNAQRRIFVVDGYRVYKLRPEDLHQ